MTAGRLYAVVNSGFAISKTLFVRIRFQKCSSSTIVTATPTTHRLNINIHISSSQALMIFFMDFSFNLVNKFSVKSIPATRPVVQDKTASKITPGE